MNLFDTQFTKFKRFRVIDYLRKKYSDVKWTYDTHGHTWNGSDGSYVRKCYSIADDGDLDIFGHEYWRYFTEKGKIPERIWCW